MACAGQRLSSNHVSERTCVDLLLGMQDVFVDLTSSPDDDDCTVHSASFSPSKRHRLSAAAAAGPSSALTQQVAASAAAELQGQAEAEMRRPQCSVCMDDIKDMMCPPCGYDARCICGSFCLACLCFCLCFLVHLCSIAIQEAFIAAGTSSVESV